MLASYDVYSKALANFSVFGDNGIILNAKYKKRNDIFFYEYSIDSIQHADFEGTIPFLVELHRDIQITAQEFMANFEIIKIVFKED